MYVFTWYSLIVAKGLHFPDYLPVYFQACKDASPTKSGVDLFGLAFSTAPSALIVGLTIAKTHRYRPQIWLAWALGIAGTGLLCTLHRNTPTSHVIGFEVIAGAGFGMLTAAVFFPILAPLPVESNALAISLYMFFRLFSGVSGSRKHAED